MRVGGGDVAAAGSDHEREFGLVIGARANSSGSTMGAPGPITTLENLLKMVGTGGNFDAGFARVIAIVHPYADEFWRARNRREQFDGGQVVSGARELPEVLPAGDHREHIPAQADHLIAGIRCRLAVASRFSLKRDQAHEVQHATATCQNG